MFLLRISENYSGTSLPLYLNPCILPFTYPVRDPLSRDPILPRWRDLLSPFKTETNDSTEGIPMYISLLRDPHTPQPEQPTPQPPQPEQPFPDTPRPEIPPIGPEDPRLPPPDPDPGPESVPQPDGLGWSE